MKNQTNPMSSQTHKNRIIGSFKVIWDNIKIILLGIVIVIVFRTFLYEPYRIPSESMLPTLEVGDFIIVEKFTYGYSRFSFPLDLLGFKGRFFESKAKRGDVAVFRLPTDTSIPYVKRIIGLPGDTIEIKEGRLYINSVIVNRKEIDTYNIQGGQKGVSRYWEEFDNTVGHELIELLGDASPYDNTPIYIVPENHYFVMGDNRDNSLDSRFLQRTGFVPFVNLIGKPIFVLFSFQISRPFGSWFKSSRIFLSII